MAVQSNLSFTAAKARDLAARAGEREFEFVFSRFLSPSEQAEYSSAILDFSPATASRTFFFGGCAAADRRCAVVVPAYIDTSDAPQAKNPRLFSASAEREAYFINTRSVFFPEEDFGITALELKGSAFGEFSHRDCLGSLLALGLEREVIGDIAVLDTSRAVVLVKREIAPFICESLDKVRRERVKVAQITLPEDFTVPRRFEKMNVICASDRFDCVVAAITNTSRAEAKELCFAGLCELCYVTETRCDARVAEGDVVSVRGYGKFIIDSFDGETRSHRQRVSVRKYI